VRQIIPYIAIITAMLIWAGAGIAVQEALEMFGPYTLIVLRFTLAVLLMLAIGWIFRRSDVLGLQRIEKRDVPLFVLGSLFQPCLYFIFETFTYKSIASPTIAEAMLSTQPVLAPIFAMVLLRERITRNNIIGIVLSTIGMLMLLLIGSNNFSLGDPWGILLAFVTVSMSVSYTIVLRRIPSHYSPLSIIFYVQLFSLALFYPLWGFTEAGQFLHDTIPHYTTLHQATPLLAVLYLAVLASVAAFVLFCYTVRKIGVTRANVFNNIRPVFTALLMWIIFDEILPIWKLVGIIVIIIGLFISQKHEKNNNN
jgi:drug/metabolite transporter (DMT)-like permease